MKFKVLRTGSMLLIGLTVVVVVGELIVTRVTFGKLLDAFCRVSVQLLSADRLRESYSCFSIRAETREKCYMLL